MFGGLVNLITPSTIGPPPKDVPPATIVQFPNYHPLQPDDLAQYTQLTPLVKLLQSLRRPIELNGDHFAALGAHVHPDAPAEDVLPDASFLPASGDQWSNTTVDETCAKNTGFRIPLSNGNDSPEARTYLERYTELSIDNQTAFRTVRRIRPEPGRKTPRLGNCYEFYRQLEQMAGYWDDTSSMPGEGGQSDDDVCEVVSKPLDISLEAELANSKAYVAAESNSRSKPKEPKPKTPYRVTYRTAPGNTMPPEIRHNLISSFIKLVSYDFGCNIAVPRVEPRLHLQATTASPSAPPSNPIKDSTASYFPSGCVFMIRTPTARDAARSGVVEGPLAAVSARNTTSFSSLTERSLDFGRELVAALVTAQHRAREGRTEARFGDGKWWATTPRWGGGEGGPIGREIEAKGEAGVAVEATGITSDSNSGSKSANPTSSAVSSSPNSTTTSTKAPENGHDLSSNSGNRPQSPPHPISPSSGLPMRGPPASKRSRKNHPTIYDNYRQVRPPASNWDRKARYTAVGKVAGADYDDVFVISGLFHHVSILRVRVPARLLEVLAGAPEEENPGDDGKGRSWGRLEVWRSQWFDLFLAEDRVEALRLLWGVNAWMMRKVEGTGTGAEGRDGNGNVKGKGVGKETDGDVVMKGT